MLINLDSVFVADLNSGVKAGGVIVNSNTDVTVNSSMQYMGVMLPGNII